MDDNKLIDQVIEYLKQPNARFGGVSPDALIVGDLASIVKRILERLDERDYQDDLDNDW